jgi:hypothetical protein
MEPEGSLDKDYKKEHATGNYTDQNECSLQYPIQFVNIFNTSLNFYVYILTCISDYRRGFGLNDCIYLHLIHTTRDYGNTALLLIYTL